MNANKLKLNYPLLDGVKTTSSKGKRIGIINIYFLNIIKWLKKA
jgi:hypothetical protein